MWPLDAPFLPQGGGDGVTKTSSCVRNDFVRSNGRSWNVSTGLYGSFLIQFIQAREQVFPVIRVNSTR